MIKPKHYINTRIINIEEDPYASKARDPYRRQQRNQLLFNWVMILAVALLAFYFSIKLGEYSTTRDVPPPATTDRPRPSYHRPPN